MLLIKLKNMIFNKYLWKTSIIIDYQTLGFLKKILLQLLHQYKNNIEHLYY